MIRKIAHTADWHIRMSTTRHQEYMNVFTNFVNDLKQTKPDLIVVAGDIFHDKLNTSNEMYLLAKQVMLSITDIAPVILIRGNHDLNIKNKKRIDSVETLVKICDTSKNSITYYNASGFYFYDENIIFVVHDHIDRINPWVEINKKKKTTEFYSKEIEEKFEQGETFDSLEEKGYTFINLFHDPISGSLTDSGERLDSPTYRKLADFKGHVLMLGDIHKYQEF
jgi:DNA repair exonuclease SbcCD nuclease subunit